MKWIGYFFIIVILFGVFQYATLPDVSKIGTCFKTEMNKVDLCPKNVSYIRLSEVSSHIKNALIISEDGSFYTHKGVDFDELKKSIETNLKKGKFARGGSTITQQLAKNLFLTKEKTLTRKAKELILTRRIEEKYSKNVILEKYLNVVEFGSGIYGVKKASDFYFQKHPSQITPLEASFLIFLLPNPKKYSESFKRKELTRFARSRIEDILYKMMFYKKIPVNDFEYYKGQLTSMWKLAPDMDNEAEDYTADYEAQTLDLNQKVELENLQEKQLESIQKLDAGSSVPEVTPEEPVLREEVKAEEDIYPQTLPDNAELVE